MAETTLQVLKKYWGYDGFIYPQSQIIDSVLNGKDTFALLPTGGGKSLTFQIPILLKDGICVVVSPLIALMKDQVINLKKRGINAEFISSELNKSDIEIILDNCRFGKIRLLYVSPERMQSSAFQEHLKTLNISYFAIDEAHCIVEWGHDFRPSYLSLKDIKNNYPNTPILAVTATATPNVQAEIIAQLQLYEPQIFKKSLQRANIAYRVQESQDKWSDIIYCLRKYKGSCIIFCRSRKDTFQLTNFLIENGLDADFYHARLSPDEKNRKQKTFINSESKILVSTNAFGMGIDKPDIRLVIHESTPDSIESYFQEVGRAGRDGEPAVGILLYNNSDKKNALKSFKAAHPDRDTFTGIIRKLYNYYQISEFENREGQLPFSEKKIRKQYGFSKQRMKTVLQFLEQKKIVKIHKGQRQSLVKILIDNYKIKNDKSTKGNVLEFIARHYGGIFHTPCIIDEYYIAKKIKIPTYLVTKALKALNESNKIYYRDAAIIKISFLEHRDDNYAKVKLWKEFEKLQKIKWDRLLAIHYFAMESQVCKSQLLLRYFGEKNVSKCGICNICKPNTSQNDLDIKDIISFIKKKERTIFEIENNFIFYDRNRLYNLLQILLDEDKIKLKLPNIYYI